MDNRREEKIREALREAAAEYLVREASPKSLITVTSAAISKDGKRAMIYITVLPENFEAEALSFANRNGGRFGEFFRTRVRGVRVPHFTFEIDRGEKNRQRIDILSDVQ